MSFILRNLTGAPLPIDDLGIELAAAEDYDMLYHHKTYRLLVE